MVSPLIPVCVVAALFSIWAVARYFLVKSGCAKYEAQFSPEPVELDPVGDAALMGTHYWARMELFDLLQKGIVKQEEDKIKRTPKTPGPLSRIQKQILDQRQNRFLSTPKTRLG